jgi:hypothetical protein
MQSWKGWAAVLGASACLFGCAPAEDERVRTLEQRVGALESRPAAPTPSAPAAATLRDVQSLESRLAALEQRVAALAAAPGSDPAAAGGTLSGETAERRLEVRRARRERLREVTDQYRAKLAAIRQQHTDPAARQQAVREALQWYRDERRAVLAGDDLAGDDPDPADVP